MGTNRVPKVLVIDPSALIAAGARRLLEESGGFRVVEYEMGNDPATAFDRIATQEPDLVLIDPALFPVVRRQPIRQSHPALQEVAIVALCHGLHDEVLLREFDAVIRLYDTPAQILHTLRQVVEQGAPAAQSEGYELSEREREILVAVARGLTNKEIADRYCISVHTVISHRKNITRKTGIKTIAGLAVYALLNNMITEADMNA